MGSACGSHALWQRFCSDQNWRDGLDERAAAIGIPQKNTVALLPKTLGGVAVTYLVLDDGSDVTQTVKNTRKFISEDNVDLVAGSSTTPDSLAMIDIVAENKVPLALTERFCQYRLAC